MFQFSNLLTTHTHTHRRFTHMSLADEWPLEVRYPYHNYANVVQLTVRTRITANRWVSCHSIRII